MDEFELIRRYFDRANTRADVVVGIGDDGAVVVPTPAMQQVSVIDTMVEGVHFPQHFNPADVGYRAVAVNLSDIAAMGATPRWMTLALSMPVADAEWLALFAEGLHTAAAEFDVALIGGDTTRAPVTVVTVQVSGEVRHGTALLRSGAKAGDTIYVTGTLGDSAAGLQGLEAGRPVKELLSRYARPSARVNYGRSLIGHASAAIDISDGLYGDLSKLLAASGVGAELDLDALPISRSLAEHFDAADCRSFALTGGDDYELCFTAPGRLPDPGILTVTAIGKVTEARDIVCTENGRPVPFSDSGYAHFKSAGA
ncbi:MAG TPA: thiamine-phosphate kinase [Woeseiaceae bacterium]|nr:thiamine-phosphate kinase [Woeseiaceae bacterium]